MRDVFVVKADRSLRMRIRSFEARDNPQERCLAGSGRTEQCDQLAVVDLEAHVVESFVAPERFRDVFDVDAHGFCTPVFWLFKSHCVEGERRGRSVGGRGGAANPAVFGGFLAACGGDGLAEHDSLAGGGRLVVAFHFPLDRGLQHERYEAQQSQ